MLDFLRKHIGYNNPLRRFWHFLRGFTAALWHGFPARKMICIGITGTNGKTTTTHLIEHILRSTGKKVGMASTVAFSVNGAMQNNDSKITTLRPMDMQKFLKQCVKQGVEYAVIEASSQALHQFRLWGIPFRVAVLTNITHEHLNYHGTMQKYAEAKKALFKGVKTAVLNTADQFFADFMKLPAPHKITYGFNQGDLQAHDINCSKFGSTFIMKNDDQKISTELKIPGEFNIENALAATGAGLACQVPIEKITEALKTFQGVPGRMERIQSPKGFEVIVDFGLTPDALEKIYKVIRTTASGRVIGIIGSCGTRDYEKRPMLGEIVAKNCELTIVTDEEPYTEDPKAIMEAVLYGALKTGKKKGIDIELIEDRYQAIEHAVAYAKAGDTIVVTGMGNFPTRSMAHGEIPWDEREVVREIIANHAAQ